MDDWLESRKAGAIRRLRNNAKWLRRLRRRARHHYPRPDSWCGRLDTWANVYERRREYVQQHYRNRKLHGGYLDGNPRQRFHMMTAQEARAAQDTRQQCAEAGVRCPRSRFAEHW